MKTEDYSRATRVINDVRQEDAAVLTVILKEDGTLFVSNCGTAETLATLYERFANYCDEVANQSYIKFRKGM